MIALVICRIDLIAASFADNPSRSMIDWVFSTTTIASSTSEPITRMRPNIVRMLSVNPSGARNANVPMSEMGMAMAGTNVARQSCRNR